MEKYDRIGQGYDQTRQADPYLVSRLKELLSVQSVKTYLDIGCGTGNYTLALQEPGANFIGMDPSLAMLSVAQSRSEQITWRQGQAEATKLPDQGVDGIIATLTIHHWTDLSQGFQELYRVLKPKGKLVIFTSTPAQMKGYWLNHYFPQMMGKSILQMPSLASVQAALAQVGFQEPLLEPYAIRHDLQDKFLYWGKEKPKAYLDPHFRKGISSFSDLANEVEVARGLARLEADIISGEIEAIMQSYANESGDYLFVSAQK